MIRQREKREVFFVCSSVKEDGSLCSNVITADSQSDAEKLFKEQNNLQSKSTFGPFYKKKNNIPQVESAKMKFSKVTKKAIFNDWNVNAFMLEEPKDHAYLIFVKKSDGTKGVPPKGTVIVNVNELRLL